MKFKLNHCNHGDKGVLTTMNVQNTEPNPYCMQEVQAGLQHHPPPPLQTLWRCAITPDDLKKKITTLWNLGQEYKLLTI